MASDMKLTKPNRRESFPDCSWRFFSQNKLCLAMAFAFFLGCNLSCAKKQVEPFQPESCEQVYVILPGNFVIDVAAGSKVMLNPSVQEFILYCSVKDAREALAHAKKDGQVLSENDWRIYRLEESFEQIGKFCHGKDICLSDIATVVDWLEPDSGQSEKAF